ncbi:hypothetical protein NBO_1391g0001 [Nosema bombycis CQ1]|uniref:Uncharacterized protein n=1 Tax=Nosema bombycis (strain CQ1 / CVCC 102059) TaxID=578461 RepID=R0KM49_NOSB1|nr:hypothetical protein NBO_1391g0001 [Nosema bombycis CQ1]|eukprot:EOB11227.1 hypothetical protein NBO_1391g0001 [Nosema bombycis CQ1]
MRFFYISSLLTLYFNIPSSICFYSTMLHTSSRNDCKSRSYSCSNTKKNIYPAKVYINFSNLHTRILPKWYFLIIKIASYALSFLLYCTVLIQIERLNKNGFTIELGSKPNSVLCQKKFLILHHFYFKLLRKHPK